MKKKKQEKIEYTSEEEKREKHFQSLFPKEKEKKKRKKTARVDAAEVARFNADLDEGLSKIQVEQRQEQGLVNKTGKKYSKTYKSIFVGNICTFFNLLCFLAALLLLSAHAPISQFTFVLIFLCNIGMGIFQEIRAKRKIDKLSILSSPTAKVVRDCKKREIAVTELVLDDILLLGAGQQVPADCIMLDGTAELNESLLTGESVPMKKENGDTLYAGSFVASGHCAVRVDKIGEDTYISKLTARAKKYKRPNSEIMNSINLFIKAIGVVIVIIAVLMFPNNFKNLGGSWADVKENGGFFALLFSNNEIMNETVQKTCSVIIGMIPAGLLLLTTVALSVGMLRLAKYNTLVQDMYSLEMLARVNVLCLDKTGTITQGKMTVSDILPLTAQPPFDLEEAVGSFIGALDDNNATFLALGERFPARGRWRAVCRTPFSSARKWSSVTFEGQGTVLVGAPEILLRGRSGLLPPAVAVSRTKL